MQSKSELEKMLSGELYDPSDSELTQIRLSARKASRQYNNIVDTEEHFDILRNILGSVGEDVSIQAPFYCDYGRNIYIGNNVYINFGCTILDCAEVRIGNTVLIGPNVQIYTATHPIDPEVRKSLLEYAKPITIEDNVWIGGSAVILPGVTIGKNSVIGAGSVVTRDIPANVVAAGNPARIIRRVAYEA